MKNKEKPQQFLCLKYSPRTDLIVSGTVSSFLAFRSCSRAFIMSSDIETITLFIAMLKALPIDSISNLTIVIGIYLMVGNGMRQASLENPMQR
jgi:hypothetical protein